MKLQDFQPGDLLILTTRTKQGEERRGAIVTAVDFNRCGLVTFTGHAIESLMQTGSGAFDPEAVGTKPFGLAVEVEKVGHLKPTRDNFRGPCPGDRGYDNMC